MGQRKSGEEVAPEDSQEAREMNCPVCGANLTCEVKLSNRLDSTVDWPGEGEVTKPGLSDWIVTDTDLSKLLLEYEKAAKYMELG